MPRRDF